MRTGVLSCANTAAQKHDSHSDWGSLMEPHSTMRHEELSAQLGRQAGHKKHTQHEGEPSLHQPFQNTAAWRFFSSPRLGGWVNTIASHCKSYTELFSEIALNRLKQPAHKNPQLIKFLLKSAMLYDDSYPSFVFPFMLVTYFFTNYFFTIIILQ